MISRVKSYCVNNRKVVVFFALIFVFQLFFFFSVLNYLSNDSREYIGIDGFAVFRGVLDAYRVPLYPLIIECFQIVFGGWGLSLLCMAQFAVFYLSCIFFYRLLGLLGCSRLPALLWTLVYAVSPATLNWVRAVLTESFSISLTIFFVYVLVRCLSSIQAEGPYKRQAAVLATITFLGTMLRPTFALYAGGAVAFFLLRSLFTSDNRRKMLISAFVAALSPLLICLYAALFCQQHHSFTLSHSYLGQQLTVMAQTGLYELGEDAEIRDTIATALSGSPDVRPRNLVLERFEPARISAFVKGIQRNHFQAYASSLWGKLNSGKLTFRAYTTAPFYAWGHFYGAIAFVFEQLITFYQGFFIALTALGVLAHRFIRHKRFDWIILFFSGCVIVTYLTSFFGTNNEYPRTAITAYPYIIFLLALICPPGKNHAAVQSRQ